MRMKRMIWFLFLCTGPAMGQALDSLNAIPPAANRKDWPVELGSGEWDYNTAFKSRLDPKSKKHKAPEFKKVKYTKGQLHRITHLLTNGALPGGLKGDKLAQNRNLMPYYNSYWVGNLTMDGEAWCIIHIPREENMHMPEDMIPETQEGAYFTTAYMVPKFRNRTLAGTKPPNPNMQEQQVNPNIQFSVANLSRWSRSNGVFIIWYGDGSTVKHFQAFTVDFDEGVSEQTVANDLKKKANSSYDYIGYTFKSGYTCRDTYEEVARKLKISIKEAQDLRLGNCSDYVWKYEK